MDAQGDTRGDRGESGAVGELVDKVVLDLRNGGAREDWADDETLRPPVDELEAAARFAASWMRYFSFGQVELSDDPGVVTSDRGFARCIVFEPRPAGRRIIHEVREQASAAGLYPLVFSRTGFTEHAMRWADDNPVALFELSANGDVTPHNRIARRLLEGSDRRHLG